jgi:tight adherence protein C
MILIFIVGLFLLFAAVVLLTRAAAVPRTRAAAALTQIDSYGYSSRGAATERPTGSLRAALDAIAGRLGGIAAPTMGEERSRKLKSALMSAGVYTISVRKLTGYRVVSAFCVAVSWLWLSPGVLGILLLPVAAYAGWWAPLQVLKSRARRRLDRVERELPELIDLLVVTVEAGLGFSGSLRMASERIQGPLGEELRLALQEQAMGLSSNEALRNMLDRCETPSMRSFVRSILQGETLGVSIGQIMRNLAVEMRKRRRANAEERAQKAPVKILFPLVLLIFPAMFVVLLGPVVFLFGDAFQ